MSQPYDRSAAVKQPGQLDKSLGEFWVENPWDIVAKGHNLSAYERKRTFLNVRGPDGGRNFLDISFLTGADSDGDGRSIVAGDFRNNGKLDLVLRHLIASVRGQPIVREMYPLNSFRSQMPSIVHFGLGAADRVEQLTIRWPSGKVQELTDLAGDRHIIVDEDAEGAEAVELIVPGKTLSPLTKRLQSASRVGVHQSPRKN